MLSPEFQKQYGALNPAQKEAVDAIEGPVMVIAGPGTGKTKILTLRIANILDKTDTPPEAILALTFTDSGVTEMRSRLNDIIQATAYRVTVTTFHAFCNDIIQQYPESFGDIAGAAALTETDQLALIQELLQSTERIEILRPPGAPLLYLKAISGSINTLKREGVTPERLEAIATRRESSIMSADDLYHEKGAHKGKMKGVWAEELKQVTKIRELVVLYKEYQKTLRQHAAYDYNDMIMEVARVLQSDEPLRMILQERYLHILVDEHQDTNNAQNRIIELLASFWERPDLFVVGDAKQAIYRFQGASLENFLYFKNLYPDARVIELEHNYRSSQSILDAAQGIRASAGQGLRANAGHPQEPIGVMALSDLDAERYAVAHQIAQKIKDGAPPHTIAVLYRDNADGQALASILEKMQTPYTVAADADVMTDPIIRKLLFILDAIRDFGQAGPLLQALHVDTLRLAPLDIYKIAKFCDKGRNPYDVMNSPALLAQAGIEHIARPTEVAAAFTRWSTAAHNDSTTDAFELIVRESGILQAILAGTHVADTLTKLHSLYDMARSLVQRNRTYTLLHFIDHLRFIQEHGLVIKSGASSALPGRVRLMTVHKSKGLEFDHVFMLGVTDEHWGPRGRRELIKIPKEVFLKSTPSSDTSDTDDDDERNLFYVALTRARKTVTITYAQHTLDGKDLLPCRFLSDMKPELLQHPDTADIESAWSAHRDIHFTKSPATTPDIADKAFLNEIFIQQGISVSALNNYLECPWKYFYRNLIRIPEASAFALMYGSAVDRALQEYFEKRQTGEDGGLEYLVQSFEGFLRHHPFQAQELATAKKKGTQSLSRWWEEYHATFPKNVINQLKVPAVPISLGDGIEINLNGKMDRVDLFGGGEVCVVDYKTGKAKSRNELLGHTKDADGDYLRQLTFYNILLDRFQEGKYRMTSGVIDFIEPDAKGIFHREAFIISTDQKAELMDRIITMGHEVLDLAFWDKSCDDKKCNYCRLRQLMGV